ncbi:amp dependent CoA ligase [Exophiala viscosa]|uniref:amp dependent CoA ligase n=1 Tax=Exophiala viscosa TaxID=2486360 RepID=UPI0021973542|nr:amp dependent CoA ligase [Exophiala viscosa]
MALFAATPAPKLPTKDILSWIFDNPDYDVKRPILIDAARPERSISNLQARKIIRQLIAGLHNLGVRKGDCVIIHSFNDIYYPIMVLAIIGSGAYFAGTNPGYTPLELKHHVKVTRAKFFISEPELLDSLLQAAQETGIPKSSVRIFDTQPNQTCPPDFVSWTELLQHGEQDWVRFDDLATCANTTAARLTSSGTTGLPKATVSTHQNFIAQHELIYGLASPKRPYEVISLISLPMFHAAVGPRVHTSLLKSGEAGYVMRRFELEPFLANVEKYKVTELYLVSALAVMICYSPLVKKYSLRSVRQGLVGAAPLDKDTQAGIRKYMSPGAPFTQVYGMTESTCIMTWFDYPEDDVTGSVGCIRPGIDAKLVDDEGNDISAYDVRGEMCIKGPTVIKEYFENPTANAESFDADGFFHTGDIMYCDGKTKLWYVVDRKKEMIKVRGFQVAPPEIEGVLLMHPAIVDAAVIGVQAASEVDGEVPRAYIVRGPGVRHEDLTEADVIEFAAKPLSKFKRLEGGVRFVDGIPKNASGKILKRVLREEVKKEGTAKAKL